MDTFLPFAIVTLMLAAPAAAGSLVWVWSLSRSRGQVIALLAVYTVTMLIVPILAFADVEPLDVDCSPDAHECDAGADGYAYWIGGALLSGVATVAVLCWVIATRPVPFQEDQRG